MSKTGRAPLGSREGTILAALFGLTLLVRLHYLFHFPFASDESQHLHAAWAWTQGLHLYRDVFDNHMPLFHILVAPLVRAIGERADILLFMRVAMLFCYAATLWGTYAIARKIFDVRTGAWSALFCGLVPPFFFTSLEFRTDDLWVALFVFTMAVLVGGPWSAKRCLVAGLLLGMAAGVSLKTVMMLGAIGLAAALLPLSINVGKVARSGVRQRVLPIGLFLGGFLAVPLGITSFFAARGDLHPYLYAVFQHNVVPGLSKWVHPLFPLLLLPGTMVVVFGLRWILPSLEAGDSERKIAFLTLTAAMYFQLYCFVWPIESRNTIFPIYPVVSVLLTGVIVEGLRPRPAKRSPGGVLSLFQRRWLLVGMGVLGLLFLATSDVPPRSDVAAPLLVWWDLLWLARPSVFLAGAFLGSWLPRWSERVNSQGAADGTSLPVLASIGVLTLLLLPAGESPRTPSLPHQIRVWSELLRLLGPSDYVMDIKGETMFWRRPFYYEIEKLTQTRLDCGLIQDRIAERCIATRTPVTVGALERFPPRARQFLGENYIDLGDFRVVGRLLTIPPDSNALTISFEVKIETRYVLLTPSGEAEGLLDGIPYTGARLLRQGIHTFEPKSDEKPLVLFWAQAEERGFSPFSKSQGESPHKN